MPDHNLQTIDRVTTADLNVIEGRRATCLSKAPLAGPLRRLLSADVPALISEIRRLREELHDTQSLLDAHLWHADNRQARVDE